MEQKLPDSAVQGILIVSGFTGAGVGLISHHFIPSLDVACGIAILVSLVAAFFLTWWVS